MHETQIEEILSRLKNLHRQVSSQTGFWSSLTTVFVDSSIEQTSHVSGKAIETLEQMSRVSDMYNPGVFGQWLDLAESTEKSLNGALGLAGNYSVYKVGSQVATNLASNAASAAKAVPGITDNLVWIVGGIVLLVVLLQLRSVLA